MTPPKPSELEVTLIGPSVGECIVLHYNDNWMVVDSCLDNESKTPAALRYLSSIAVDPEKIKLIACSHWHDDHIRGISAILEAAPNAKFCMSNALASREFLSLVHVYKDGLSDEAPFTSGISELTRSLEILKSRNLPPRLASQDLRLYRSPSGDVELWALSPSPQNLSDSLVRLAELMPQVWTNRFTLPAKGPNHLAVAMHFRAGQHSVLLGSDLEEHGNQNTGWSAVIASPERPPQKAGLYKVAHHGSQTGEHPGIWTDLLLPTPVSILTPFSRSKLPRDSDVNRINEKSAGLYISAHGPRPALKRTGALAKMVKSKNLSTIDVRQGMLQCRVDCAAIDAQWQVTEYGSARRL